MTVAEANETNNTYYKRFLVVGPDLIIITLTGPTTVTPGQVISLSEATRNQGRAATTFNTVTGYYLSKDSMLDASDVFLGVILLDFTPPYSILYFTPLES